MTDAPEEETALNKAAYQFSDYNYTPNNKSAAISWATQYLSTQYEPYSVDYLIETARKIEAYLDGVTA